MVVKTHGYADGSGRVSRSSRETTPHHNSPDAGSTPAAPDLWLEKFPYIPPTETDFVGHFREMQEKIRKKYGVKP